MGSSVTGRHHQLCQDRRAGARPYSGANETLARDRTHGMLYVKTVFSLQHGITLMGSLTGSHVMPATKRTATGPDHLRKVQKPRPTVSTALLK